MTISPSGLKPFLLSLFIASLLTACSSTPTNSNSGSSSSAPAASSSSSEAFEGLITSKMNAGSQAMEIKYAVKGPRTRIETQLSAGGTQMGVMMMDFASGSQTMLMPQTKTYMNLNMAEKIAESVEKAGADNYFKATPTGKTETVAGHSCTHWILGEKQDTDACLAKGLGYFGGGGQSDGIFGKLKNIALGDKTKAQLQANPEFLKFVEGGVFPLKLATIENGQPRTIMEVTSVERKPLDDSLFTIPADYKKMEIPGMPAGKK